MPKGWTFECVTADGTTPQGVRQEQRFAWIVPLNPRQAAVQPVMTFQRDWINAIYTVRIRPERDILIRRING